VQALPSSQGRSLGVVTHPASPQLSSVQGLPSEQSSAGPGAHVPSLQVSARVHAFPSSQSEKLGACWQPSSGSQLSVVQGLSSSHSTASPTQTPSSQWSVFVHTVPSRHSPPVRGSFVQPSSPRQESSVHGLPSSQVPSSNKPLQSSSTPLHTSAAGAAASQSAKPASPQIRTPSHAPNSFLTEHGVESAEATASAVHSQVPASFTH
jgi:hypothetical protein